MVKENDAMNQQISRREYLAASALQALIAKVGDAWDSDGLFEIESMESTHSVADWNQVARQSVVLADLLMGELDG